MRVQVRKVSNQNPTNPLSLENPHIPPCHSSNLCPNSLPQPQNSSDKFDKRTKMAIFSIVADHKTANSTESAANSAKSGPQFRRPVFLPPFSVRNMPESGTRLPQKPCNVLYIALVSQWPWLTLVRLPVLVLANVKTRQLRPYGPNLMFLINCAEKFM